MSAGEVIRRSPSGPVIGGVFAFGGAGKVGTNNTAITVAPVVVLSDTLNFGTDRSAIISGSITATVANTTAAPIDIVADVKISGASIYQTGAPAITIPDHGSVLVTLPINLQAYQSLALTCEMSAVSSPGVTATAVQFQFTEILF